MRRYLNELSDTVLANWRQEIICLLFVGDLGIMWGILHLCLADPWFDVPGLLMACIMIGAGTGFGIGHLNGRWTQRNRTLGIIEWWIV